MSLEFSDGGLAFGVQPPPLNNDQQRMEEIRNRPIRRSFTDYLDYVFYDRLWLGRKIERTRAVENNRVAQQNTNPCCFAVLHKIFSSYLS